jgi:hypothetical protein
VLLCSHPLRSFVCLLCFTPFALLFCCPLLCFFCTVDGNPSEDQLPPLASVTFARYCELAQLATPSPTGTADDATPARMNDVAVVRLVNAACDRAGVRESMGVLLL